MICNILKGAALALGLLMGVGAADATPLDNGNMRAAAVRARDEPIETLLQSVEHAHPIAMLLLAKRLYDLDRRDEAVFWFYVGQLRWRACMATCGGGQAFARLHETIGPDLNQHAFRTLPAFQSMVESVLAWDASHHDDYANQPEKDEARAGLSELVEYAQAHAAELTARQEELAREAAVRGDDPYAGDGGAIMGMPQELLTAYDPERFSAFRRNVTTREEVIGALGRPEWWSTDANGGSTFGYSYLRTTDVTAILGISQQVQVTLEFDASRLLRDITLPRD